MAGGLIEWARDEAERLAPPVRAAALMRIARVVSAGDRDEARDLFDRALAEARSVPGREGEALLEDARMYAAAVVPERVSEIPTGKHFSQRFLSDQVGKIMLQHGHFDAALEFVLHEDAASFPFNLAHQLIDKLNGEKQLSVLRRTIDAWRQGHSDAPGPGPLNGFLHLFCGKWNLLPTEEARRVARELVDGALQESDAPITAHYGSAPQLEITSWREHVLFQILHVLRVVDPEMAVSLIGTHAQLANAARRWPNGLESIREEADARRRVRESEGKACGGFMMAGSPDSFPYLQALRKSSGDGDFLPAFEFAAKKYLEDSAPANPNLALKASWPSSCMYCKVLYQAGRRLGEVAGLFLAEIPDPDQRLLARIELAAAVAGLPEFRQTQRGFFGRRERRVG